MSFGLGCVRVANTPSALKQLLKTTTMYSYKTCSALHSCTAAFSTTSSKYIRSRARDGPRGFRRHEQNILPQARSPVKRSSDNHSDEPPTHTMALVNCPQDAEGILDSENAQNAAKILRQPVIVVCRQIEMMNVFIGFEEANKYVIYNAEGETIGYIAEDSHTITSTMARNLAGTHRAFSCHVLDPAGQVVLKIRRGFAWINSHIQIFHVGNNGEELIGEVKQIWSMLRRKYELFLHRDGTMQQFGAIDEPTLSWDFSIISDDKKLVGSINRNLRGLVREVFTDTGHYVLRMDDVDPSTTNISTSALVVQGENAEARSAVANTSTRALLNIEKKSIKLDERAVLLATAVSIDFDYFSKLSGAGHGGFMPMPFFFPMGSPGGVPESTPGALPEAELPGVSSDDETTPGEYGNDNVDQPAQVIDDRPWWEQGQQTADQSQEQNWWDESTNQPGEGGGWGSGDGDFDGWD